ncbi:hypothetical protein L7F22_055862 [Adiantum nelumboides]|nr:hypothetical protein [Adiantum nelumboides]
MQDAGFTCAICLEKPEREAVVTACGHLFCWSCLRLWLPNKRVCPCCKDAKVLPLVVVAGKSKAVELANGGEGDDKRDQYDATIHEPDFSCRCCSKPQARQPVVLEECGHVYCWRCLHPLIIATDAPKLCCVPYCRSSSVKASPVFSTQGAEHGEVARAAGEEQCSTILPSRLSLISGSRRRAYDACLSADFITAVGDARVDTAQPRSATSTHALIVDWFQIFML